METAEDKPEVTQEESEEVVEILEKQFSFPKYFVASMSFLGRKQSLPVIHQWQYYRQLGRKQLSPEAQLKLEWIIFYHTVGSRSATLTAFHFGISRKTLYKWLKRFRKNDLQLLEEFDRVPRVRRIWTVTKVEEQRIIDLRRTFIALGKAKLKRLYQTTYGSRISAWKIERVIRRHKLYPDHVKRKAYFAKNRTIAKKVRIHHLKQEIREKKKQFGYLWHVDTVIIWWYGTRRYIFTAVEEQTRIAFARVCESNTSYRARDFLKRLLYLTDGHIEILHTDNGSEFQGLFEQTLKNLGIKQVYSRPHTPKDNAKLERFNATIQKEWLDNSLVGLDTIEEANKDLTNWLITYNSVRPHAALDYQTPLEFAQKHYFQVLPKTPAQTKT